MTQEHRLKKTQSLSGIAEHQRGQQQKSGTGEDSLSGPYAPAGTKRLDER